MVKLECVMLIVMGTLPQIIPAEMENVNLVLHVL